jgi:hypothetical protein
LPYLSCRIHDPGQAARVYRYISAAAGDDQPLTSAPPEDCKVPARHATVTDNPYRPVRPDPNILGPAGELFPFVTIFRQWYTPFIFPQTVTESNGFVDETRAGKVCHQYSDARSVIAAESIMRQDVSSFERNRTEIPDAVQAREVRPAIPPRCGASGGKPWRRRTATRMVAGNKIREYERVADADAASTQVIHIYFVFVVRVRFYEMVSNVLPFAIQLVVRPQLILILDF